LEIECDFSRDAFKDDGVKEEGHDCRGCCAEGGVDGDVAYNVV